jgi:lysozyme
MSRAVVMVSPAGVLFVARWEGMRLAPYNDAANNATVGVGHLLHAGPVTTEDRRRFRSFSRSDALKLLAGDLLVAEDVLRTEVSPPLTSPAHFDALASFVFNVGAGAFLDSTLRRRLNAGERGVTAADELLRWTSAGGRRVEGLVRRRLAERRLYLHGDYGTGP